MQINHKILLLLVLILSSSTVALAQRSKPNFTLASPESGIRNYRAQNFISMNGGFRYTAITGNSFKAVIDKTLTFDITTISNPKPGELTTASSSSDTIYVPGGSFGTDPVQQLPPLTSVTHIASGSGFGSPGGGSILFNDTIYTYPVLWFKTVPVTNNLNGEYCWRDITTNPTQLKTYNAQGVGTEYKLTRDKLRSYNFNLAIDLTSDMLTKEVQVKKSNLAQATIIGVWGSNDDVLNDKFMFAIKGRLKDTVMFSKTSVKHFDTVVPTLNFGNDTSRNFVYNLGDIEGESLVDSSKFNEKTLRVGTMYRSNKPTNSVWGEPQQSTIVLGGKLDTTVMRNLGTGSNSIQAMDGYRGFTPELIVFDRQLSPLECNKYETYLALKYGLTLDKSYISANGQVIWNVTNNVDYNNRITGYGREAAMGLYQRMSTTSYEEAPCYSKDSLYDSFDCNDSYRLASKNRLLVMGLQPGSDLNDSKYVIFGDNNDPITTQNGIMDGLSVMNRKWVVATNIIPVQSNDKLLTWSESGIRSENVTDFKRDIIKNGSMSSSSAITTEKLKGEDGYFAWTVEEEYGPLTVKFGSNQSSLSIADYGYQIDVEGKVYRILKGSIGNSTLFTVQKGQRIEVEKHGRIMVLRVNGIRYKNTEFLIDTLHCNNDFYGALSFASNPFDVKLSDFRHGGFVDTGHRVELSYSPLKASAFSNFKDKKAFIIIDRLSSGTIDTVRSDEYDEARSKIIFNNVFWDTDGNGQDTFTFGYVNNAAGNFVKQNKEDNDELDRKNEIKIYYPDIHNLRNVRVRIQTAKPSPAIIHLFDISGRCLLTRNVSNIVNYVGYVDVNLPTGGMYIITVTTNAMKHTQKVVSRD